MQLLVRDRVETRPVPPFAGSIRRSNGEERRWGAQFAEKARLDPYGFFSYESAPEETEARRQAEGSGLSGPLTDSSIRGSR